MYVLKWGIAMAILDKTTSIVNNVDQTFDHIQIVTKPPGPKAIERQMAISKLSTPFCGSFPFVFDDHGRGSGSYVLDIDGNVFLDFNSQICSNPIGYNHPAMIEALTPYLHRTPLKVAGDDFFLLERLELQEAVLSICPPNIKRAFLINSGAEAVDNAIKTAYYYTKRTVGVSLQGAFHGRTLGALSFTNSNNKHKEFFPSLPVRRIPFVGENATNEEIDYSLNFVQNLLYQDASANDIAFVIFEPIQGEGGYRVPHPKYIQEIRKITKENNILLIADEVQAGMGRTGKMWGHEHHNITVDLMSAGKALQVGATLGSEEVFFSKESDACRISSTWGGGDIIGLVMGTEVIHIIQKEHLLENVVKQGQYLSTRLRELANKCANNKHVILDQPKGRGLMLGLSIKKPGMTKNYDNYTKIARNKIVDECYHRGLLILGAGWNNIRFAPPLNVTKENIDEALNVFEEAVFAVEHAL